MRVRGRRGAGSVSWWRVVDASGEPGELRAGPAPTAIGDPDGEPDGEPDPEPVTDDAEAADGPAGRPGAVHPDAGGETPDDPPEAEADDDVSDPAPPGTEPRPEHVLRVPGAPPGLPEPAAADGLRVEARRVRDQAAADIRALRGSLREIAEKIRARREEAHAAAWELLGQADAIDRAWAMIDARRQLEDEARGLEAEAVEAEDAARAAEAALADAERRHQALEGRLAEVPEERERCRAALSQATTEARSLAELTGMRQSLGMLDAVVADREVERDVVAVQITALAAETEVAREHAEATRRRADARHWQAQHDPLDEDISPAPVPSAALGAAAEGEDGVEAMAGADEEEGERPSPGGADAEPGADVAAGAGDEVEDIAPALPAPREG